MLEISIPSRVDAPPPPYVPFQAGSFFSKASHPHILAIYHRWSKSTDQQHSLNISAHNISHLPRNNKCNKRGMGRGGTLPMNFMESWDNPDNAIEGWQWDIKR